MPPWYGRKKLSSFWYHNWLKLNLSEIWIALWYRIQISSRILFHQLVGKCFFPNFTIISTHMILHKNLVPNSQPLLSGFDILHTFTTLTTNSFPVQCWILINFHQAILYVKKMLHCLVKIIVEKSVNYSQFSCYYPMFIVIGTKIIQYHGNQSW